MPRDADEPVGLIVLDGPLGTELDHRGVETRLPAWSAGALRTHPEVVAAIHRDYAAAGATVHTTNTFRTRARTVGEAWESLARRAVRLARDAVPRAHRVAGSLAPLEDCYRPTLSPANPRGEHRALAEVLADAGCDLLLCETFPHVGEAVVAVEEAVRTGTETWVSFTAGPDNDLLSTTAMVEGARAAVGVGARAVMVNCTPGVDTLPYVEALAGAALGVRVGAYANAGRPDDVIGWASDRDASVEAYAALARRWVDAGGSIVGGCCGTRPAHVRALARLRDDGAS